MTKTQFLDRLEKELKHNNVPDADDILGEYEQHFSFKLADGFSEEEIAAKLGNPTVLASQFETGSGDKHRGSRALTITGLCFADIFSAVFFVLLFAWAVIMAAFALCCAAAAVCLLGGLNIQSLIPPMPYWCGAVFGLSLAALATLTAVGCIYFLAFVQQLMRSYGRFHHNALAAASGKAILPSLAIYPQLAPRTNRRFRTAALIALALFAVCFVLGMFVSMLSSGTLEFWHAWGWFGYTAP